MAKATAPVPRLHPAAERAYHSGRLLGSLSFTRDKPMNSRSRPARLVTVLWRSGRLRCPVCGRGKLFAGLFSMYPACSECRTVYQREPGFFLGAIYFNYGLRHCWPRRPISRSLFSGPSRLSCCAGPSWASCPVSRVVLSPCTQLVVGTGSAAGPAANPVRLADASMPQSSGDSETR